MPAERPVTPDQILLVQASWPVIAANAERLTTDFYAFLFEIDESAARLFTGVDMVAQRTKLAQSLAVVVESLDNLDHLLPAIAALGKRHTHYGVEHHHFDSVGEALSRALARTLGDGFTTDVRTAWADAYVLVASVMQRALVRAEALSA
jgi:hemoglobin-like flavoprotein